MLFSGAKSSYSQCICQLKQFQIFKLEESNKELTNKNLEVQKDLQRENQDIEDLKELCLELETGSKKAEDAISKITAEKNKLGLKLIKEREQAKFIISQVNLILSVKKG